MGGFKIDQVKGKQSNEKYNHKPLISGGGGGGGGQNVRPALLSRECSLLIRE